MSKVKSIYEAARKAEAAYQGILYSLGDSAFYGIALKHYQAAHNLALEILAECPNVEDSPVESTEK